MSVTIGSDIAFHFNKNINVHKENSGESWRFLCIYPGYIKIELRNSPNFSHSSKNAEQVNTVLTLNSFAQFRLSSSGFFMEKIWKTSVQLQCRIKIHWEIWFSSQPWYPQKLCLGVTQLLWLSQKSVLSSDCIKNEITHTTNKGSPSDDVV